MMNPEAELLLRYADEHSEGAFAEIVRRHIGFVYAAALRQTHGDSHLARDVTQLVFTDLARKAASVARHPVLAGWLHTSVRFAAGRLRRTERRRQKRELEAAMHELNDEPLPTADWSRIKPELDALIGRLKPRDRDAILLRFFEGRTFSEIGARLALTETAARSRVDRALEKLHEHLARRGITSTAALHSLLVMTKLKVGIAAAIMVGAIATSVVEVRANRTLRAELHMLGQSQEQLAREQRETQRLTAALQKTSAQSPETTELATLQKRAAQLEARPDGVTDAALHPPQNVGRATPEAAFETFWWALQHRDLDTLAGMIRFRDDSPQQRAAFMAQFSEAVRARYQTPEHLIASACFNLGKTEPDPIAALQIYDAREQHGPGQVRMKVWIRTASGGETGAEDRLSRFPDGWDLYLGSLSDKAQRDLIEKRIDPVTGDYVQPHP